MPVEERFDQNALVLAVNANIDDVGGESRVAVGRDARVTQEETIRSAGRRHRNHWNARPKFRGEPFDDAYDFGIQRRRRAKNWLPNWCDGNLIVGQDAQQRFLNFLDRRAGGRSGRCWRPTSA